MELSYTSFFVGGAWVPPTTNRVITVVNPSTERAFGVVPEGMEADVDWAVDAARRAFDDPTGWSTWEPGRRAEVMLRLAVAIEQRAASFAERVSAQNGMPITIARESEARVPAVILRYFAQLALECPFDEIRPGMLGGSVEVRRLPVGVVAAVVPWNFPQVLTMHKLAPALAAGCTVVLKPSPETVLDAFLLAEAVEQAGFPAGVVNVVPAGREVGAYLVAHPGVDKVAFTGSTDAGRAIAETCGRLLRPVTLELGGKSAAIVLDDADLTLPGIDTALFNVTLLNNGQTCHLCTRVMAPRKRYDEVVDAMTDLARSLTVGDASDPQTRIGPLATSRQRDRVESYIAKGVADGARITTGGGRPKDRDRGWFVEPTIFADVDNATTIAQEEIFGPVVSVIRYDDVDHAVRMANASDFGLAGTVWTSDPARGAAVARRVRTGTVGLNGYRPDPVAPFGGMKASGLGRELGPEGLLAYQEHQTIYR
jgi:aldehyde dehydrogenase (NAD+)